MKFLHNGNSIRGKKQGYHIWSTHPEHNSIKALVSCLKLHTANWELTNESASADLWAFDGDLLADSTDTESLADRSLFSVEKLVKYYNTCPNPKPIVIFMANSFKPMPHPNWVYFKTPINVRILHKWLEARNFTSSETAEVEAQEEALTENIKPKWQTQSFKMLTWPNISQYSDSADIIVLCSLMMRDWYDYDKLLSFSHIDKEILFKLMNDAEEEDNLVYLDDTDTAGVDERDEREAMSITSELSMVTTTMPVDSAENQGNFKSSDTGLFKKLLNWFNR